MTAITKPALDVITITITGHPVPKGRPRFAMRGGRPRTYTDAKTSRWESDARLEARARLGARRPLTGPLRLEVGIHLTIPASWPDWKRNAALRGNIRPTGKPDLDNVLKATKDAMNGILWLDDSQVVDITARKHYTDAPRVTLIVTALAAHPANTASRAAYRADGGT